MRRLTRRPWFGPRRLLGWGWSPVSWQGWMVVGLFVVGIACAAVFLHSIVLILAVEALLIVALLVICLLTGTPPTATWRNEGDW